MYHCTLNKGMVALFFVLVNKTNICLYIACNDILVSVYIQVVDLVMT